MLVGSFEGRKTLQKHMMSYFHVVTVNLLNALGTLRSDMIDLLRFGTKQATEQKNHLSVQFVSVQIVLNKSVLPLFPHKISDFVDKYW